ncbi:G protein-coupled receptor [Oryctes borbonicus]|uniref:G protein-coupled receptor n=1 Tax=Oryctes borbonicus TaxID=1629725 RepID=A0A0T6BFT8_9SCAR|nr:G protein-coupled receptor [Oryctes borbonicus]
MALDQHWFITTALIISSLIAVTANALLLLVFFRRRGLRTISNRFVINLLITNLLSSVFLVPLLIIDQDNPDLASTSSSTTPAMFENISTELSVDSSTNLLFEGIVSEETEQIINGDLKQEKITIRNGIDALEIDVSSNRSASPSEPLRTRTNDVLCFFAQSTTNLICTASIFSILLIGIDQYFAVVHPLRYHFYIDKYRSTALIGSCWIFSIVIASVDVLISIDCDFWRFCSQRVTETDEIRASLRIAFSFVYFFVVIVTPFVTICAIYVCIYAAAHENSERMRKSTSTNNTATPNSYSQLPLKGHESSDDSPNDDHQKKISSTIPKVHSAPNFINLVEMAEEKEPQRETPPVKVSRSCSDRVSHKNIIISLKCRISNASVFRYREETRAAKISLLVIFMVLVCYAPYGLAVLLNTELYKPKMPRFFNYISLMLLVISDTISPFLFAYRSRRVQRELLKFLRVLPPKTTNGDSPKHHQFPKSAEDEDAPAKHNNEEDDAAAREEAEIAEPFIAGNFQIPKVVVTCKVENEKKSILKRVCSKNWTNYKKCNFITVPDSCLDARGSFSSASTQISSEE